MFFYKSEDYISEAGFMVKEAQQFQWNELTGEKESTGLISYTGTFVLTVGTDRGPQNFPITFDFPEKFTLKNCFDKFEEYATKKVEEIKEDKRKKDLIVAPSAVNHDLGRKNIINFNPK